jgi:hypothetical protein
VKKVTSKTPKQFDFTHCPELVERQIDLPPQSLKRSPPSLTGKNKCFLNAWLNWLASRQNIYKVLPFSLSLHLLPVSRFRQKTRAEV